MEGEGKKFSWTAKKTQFNNNWKRVNELKG